MVSTLTRMVFIKNKKTGNISSFLMSIVGSKAYHANNEVKLGNNNYLQREKNFSGYIMYHDLTGKYVNGWVYKNGKIKGTLSKQTGDDLKTELKMAVACSTYEITTYYEQCTRWCKDSNGDREPQPGEYTNTTGVEYAVTSTYMECQPYLTDDEGGGGYIPADDVEQPCNCVNTCPVCGGCLELELKSAILPGSGGTPTVSCPECSCPTDPQTLICNAYLGLINMPSIKENNQNFSPHQEQFIISLANIAALYQLGYSLNGIMNNLVPYQQSSTLYTKLNKLCNPHTYIAHWDSAHDSYTGKNDAFISPNLGNTGFQLKYYKLKNGESNAIGMVKNGSEHYIEGALEYLEAYLRDNFHFADDFIYDMHLFNALNYMEYYCSD